MNEALIIAHDFPPCSNTESILLTKNILHLDKFGWNATVWTADPARMFNAFGKGEFLNSAITEKGAAITKKLLPTCERSLWLRALVKIIPDIGRIPDIAIVWAANKNLPLGEKKFDIIYSHSSPLSGHLLAYRIKKKTGLPWVAHFSDPWTDNQYFNYSPLSRAINKKLEAKVAERADALVFTAEETLDIFMSKYPASWRNKAHYIPNNFEPAWFPENTTPADPSKILIRYIGAFYGPRHPFHLINAFGQFLRHHPEKAAIFRFEFIGSQFEHLDKSKINWSGWQDYFLARPPVDYHESLRLMREADWSLVIDAPVDRGLMLHAKFVDSIGARRPIWALTPAQGPMGKLMERLPLSFRADPIDQEKMIENMHSIHDIFRARTHLEWNCPDDIHKGFMAETGTRQLVEVMNKLTGKR